MEKKLLLQLAHKHAHSGERPWARPWRWAKTAFFLAAMLASLLLVCAPPLLVVVLDVALPPALFSASLRAAGAEEDYLHGGSVAAAAMAQARAFDFRSSLVDLPAVSAARASIILCAYAFCGGGAAYLWVVAACAAGSASYVLAKATAVLPRHAATCRDARHDGRRTGRHAPAVAVARRRAPGRGVPNQLPRAPPAARVQDRRRSSQAKRRSPNIQRPEAM